MEPSREPGFAALLAAARSGRGEAQEVLVRRYWLELTRFVRARCGPGLLRREEPEDVRNRAVATFLRRLPSFPGSLSERELRARLFQIAKWELGNALKRPREAREGSVAEYEVATPSVTRGTVTREDDARALREVLGRMPPDYSKVLRLRILEGCSTVETARKLGISEDNVKQRLLRARAELEQRARHLR